MSMTRPPDIRPVVAFDRFALWCVLGLVGCGDGTGPLLEFPDQPAPDPQPPVVAFKDVRVVSTQTDRSLEGQTVLVRDGTIEAVGPVASVVRTMLNERDSIDTGALLGPDLFIASPGMDGPGGPWAESTAPVATVAEARQTVAEYAAAGYDFIKVYNLLAPDVYEAIVDEAALHGIPLVGHVPSRVGIERVQSVDQRTSEHFIGLKLAASSGFTAGTIDVSRVRELVTRSAAVGLWHTPTITVDALSRDERDAIRAGHELGFIAPGVREFFESGFHHGLTGATASRERDNHELMIREVDRAGAGLLVGTDAGFGWMLPGFSIHDELDGIVAAGLEPSEVLKAATVNAAAALGVSGEMGQVIPGFRADLILVPADPLRDVRAIRDHDGVMVRGRWLSRGTLDTWLEQIRAGYGN